MKNFRFLSFAIVAIMAVSSSLYFNSCKQDPCKDVVCQNGGQCVDGTCTCVAGYEGTNCETEMRTKFIVSGQSFTETGCGATYNMTISKGAAVTEILIENLGNYTCTSGTYTVKATVDGTSITIPSQTVCSTVFSGSGSVSGGKISITYTATYGTPTVTDNCTATQN